MKLNNNNLVMILLNSLYISLSIKLLALQKLKIILAKLYTNIKNEIYKNMRYLTYIN